MTEGVGVAPATAARVEAEVEPTSYALIRTARQRRIRATLAGAIFVLAGTYAAFGASLFTQYEVALIVVYAIAALGQDLLMGRAGQVSLGAAAFMAVGAFMTAALDKVSWAPFPLPIVISALAGGFIGLLVGVVGLRFRGLYLALATLALQFIVSFAGHRYQGDTGGGLVVGIPKLGGLTFNPGQSLLLMLFVVLLVVIVALSALYKRAPGRAWASIRQSEAAAAVAGVDVRRWKLLAFVASSAVIAIGGSMYAYVLGTVSYVPFSLELAVSILTIVFVGGLGSISGALVGSVFVVLLPHWLQDLAGQLPTSGSVGTWISTNSSEMAVAIYGLALLIVLLFERDGLAGIVNRTLDRVVQWRAGRRRAPRPGSGS
jgi:branched-chain amino acid transport system permease protein